MKALIRPGVAATIDSQGEVGREVSSLLAGYHVGVFASTLKCQPEEDWWVEDCLIRSEYEHLPLNDLDVSLLVQDDVFRLKVSVDDVPLVQVPTQLLLCDIHRWNAITQRKRSSSSTNVMWLVTTCF